MPIPASELSETFAAIIENTGKSIVRVEGGRRRPTSGIAWSPSIVVTAAHGIEREELVVGVEGAEYKARLKGRDDSTDLALLEVDGQLPPATFVDGDTLKVGHLVLMLARPGETVRATSGIVSALGKKPWRSARGGEIDRYLEADAPHQPGFSGGPLVDTGGRVLGVVSTGLLRHTSLAIPTPTVRRVVAQLEQHGRIRRSYLGLKMQPVVLPDDVKQQTGDEIGLVVLGVEKDGPADKAGILYGDTMLHLGDASVKTLHDLHTYLRQDHVGQQVPVKLFRNGQVLDVQLTLGAK